ncbi:hypothetical protein P3C58_32355, partial [Mesorhizobium sp. XAP10]|uniref:hypothetical protein n=1 Tax=unclassified Mesorhizobium TaxID=325217 RepID=UPI0023E00ECC
HPMGTVQRPNLDSAVFVPPSANRPSVVALVNPYGNPSDLSIFARWLAISAALSPQGLGLTRLGGAMADTEINQNEARKRPFPLP